MDWACGRRRETIDVGCAAAAPFYNGQEDETWVDGNGQISWVLIQEDSLPTGIGRTKKSGTSDGGGDVDADRCAARDRAAVR